MLMMIVIFVIKMLERINMRLMSVNNARVIQWWRFAAAALQCTRLGNSAPSAMHSPLGKIRTKSGSSTVAIPPVHAS